jgi:hypothetical protein
MVPTFLMTMKHVDYTRLLTQARRLHTDLRSCPRSQETQAERLALYHTVQKKLDVVCAGANVIGPGDQAAEISRAARELILDAMYQVGKSQEGLLGPEGLDHRYELLLESVKDSSNLA